MTFRLIAISTGLASLVQPAALAQNTPSESRSDILIGPAPTGLRTPSPMRSPPAVTRPQVLSVAELKRRALLEKCKAARGEWQVKIKGLSVGAIGTDVDEIYGKIWISTSFARPETFRQTMRLRGWNMQTLWGTKEPVNLGKYTQTALSTITVPGGPISQPVSVNVHFDLWDEDSPGRDEYFYIPNNKDPFGYKNFYAFKTIIPTCDQAPEFERVSQLSITGRADGTARGNAVTARVRVVWSRKFE